MTSSNRRLLDLPFSLIAFVKLVFGAALLLLLGYLLGCLTTVCFWLFVGVYLAAALVIYVTVRVSEDSSGEPSVWWWLFTKGFRCLNWLIPWYRLPRYIGSMNLLAMRYEVRRYNLHDTSQGFDNNLRVNALQQSTGAAVPPLEWDPKFRVERSADGTFNDLDQPIMGSAGTRFGRNTPPASIHPEEPPELYSPSPREISRHLMTRNEFIPATTLNVLAAAWIQFQNHDWFNHRRSPQVHEIPLKPGDPWPENPMRIRQSERDASRQTGVPTFINTESHWWDASQLYGSQQSVQDTLRAHDDGKLKLENGRLLAEIDPALPGLDLTGFNQNYWIGLSLLHTLFTLEHNAICDRLHRDYPSWGDEKLFQTARLVNAALIAKIHTVEWTPAILGHPALQISMNGNWNGILREQFKLAFGRISDSEVISGIAGSPTNHHTAPYYLTEEFVSVYRLHPLIPDDYVFRAARNHGELGSATFEAIQGNHTRQVMQQYAMDDLLYSFGVAHPGAVTLHNFPKALQNFEFIKEQQPSRVDLAAVDVMRDRERGVPRYNEFRKMLRKKPIKRFRDLTSNPQLADEIESVYRGQIDQVDLMVGLFAEPLPPGFGFSDTAFRIFILMASRRIKSDRFFTTDYTPAVYSQIGIDWVERNNMRTVLQRHFPGVTPALLRSKNAFAPWSRVN